MSARMRLTLPAALAGALAVPGVAAAAEMTISVEIPRLSVAEYHRPYVAIWIEKPDETAVRTLAVWYEADQKEGKGATWLKDMRTWWRRQGRTLTMPANGVSGPTRAPGKQQIVIKAGQLNGIAPGSYNLVIEAAREVGGREVVKIPFQWPPKPGARGAGKGSTELGAVTLTLKP